MKKKFLLACMLITMAFSSVACGNVSDNDDEERSSRKEKEDENKDTDNEKEDDDSNKKAEEGSGMNSFFANLGLLDETAVYVEDEPVAAATEEYYYDDNVAAVTETVDTESVASVSNPVFFEQDGIKMSAIEFSEDYSEMVFKVENNNPDNKKFNFKMTQIRRNNIGNCSDDFSEQCLAGTSASYNSYVESYNYEQFYDSLNISYEDRKVYELVFELQVQIGSDSEWETRKISLKTDDYIDDYKKLYVSDFKKYSVLNATTDINPNVQISTELTNGSNYGHNYSESTIFENFENFNVYHKEVDDGIIYVFENNSNIDLIDQYYNVGFSIVANEKVYYYDSYNMYDHWELSSNGGVSAIKLSNTAQKYRALLEIPNDVPLSLMIVFNTNDSHETHLYGYLCPLE